MRGKKRPALQEKTKSVLFWLKSGTYCVSARSGKAGADRDLIRGTIAIALMILAVLDITGDAAVYIFTAIIFLVFHYDFISFPGMLSVCPARGFFIP